MTCAFFGNRYINETDAESQLWEKLIYMVEHVGVKTFYVGNQGAFDFLVRKQLIKLQKIYPFIKYYVVLAYLPKVKKKTMNSTMKIPFCRTGSNCARLNLQ